MEMSLPVDPLRLVWSDDLHWVFRLAMVTGEKKSEALRVVLESAAFRRAQVLKTLLRYLFEQESLGRGHEITESEIALKALGRTAGFTPETDSSVRTRFAALRKKLDEYYNTEGRDDGMRLDVPRGSYSLRFLTVHEGGENGAGNETVETVVPHRFQGRHISLRVFVMGVLAGVVAVTAAAAALWLWNGRAEADADETLRFVWGPMLEPGASVTIAVGTPPSFLVRDFGDAPPPAGDPSYRLSVPEDQEFREWYRRTRGRYIGRTAILHPSAHSPIWGDAAAAVTVSRLLGTYGASVEVTPSARVHPVALRDRNAVLIGRVEYNDAAEAFIPPHGLTIEYCSEARKIGVHNRAPRQGEPKWWFASGGLKNYGLITVVPSGTAAKRRVILFSGINSDGAEAGARFLTSPVKLNDLARQFEQAGVAKWPAAYQVVVSTKSRDTYSLQTEFEFLRLLK